MMEFYFPKLKKKVMAEPVSGKAYRARGGSVRYGLQAMHDGAKSLPKYVSRDEYGRLGFSAEQADAELPAYVPKVAYAEEAPVPASPLEDTPSASPEPAEPTNENFSAELDEDLEFQNHPVQVRIFDVGADLDGKALPDDEEKRLIEKHQERLFRKVGGKIDDIEEVEATFTENGKEGIIAGYVESDPNENFSAEIEGVVDYTRREEKNITVDQTVQQDYTVDTDPEDIPENKMDEVEQAINDEVEGVVSSDPANHDNTLNDISVDTSVEVPDEDGDMVEVSAYGYTDEPMITDEQPIREHTNYVSYYSESENSVHQFKGESSSCCDAETYRYKSEGDWLCMACDEFQAEFSPEELAKSSAIHGDFDHASINYSGHQNLLARAETRLNEDTYETTCDCGTVLKWMPLASATEKDGTRKMQKDMTVEQLEFPTPSFDHFEEEITMECPTCGEYHTCYIEAPVYNDRLKVDFGAEEPVIEEPDFIPEGDGRALGQQNSSVNLSPLHAENSTYEYVMGMIEDLSDDDYTDFCYEMDIDPDDTEELSSFIMSNYDSNRVMKFLKNRGMVEGYQSEGMSRNAKMALGFTAIGLGIAAWKGKELVSLFDSLKEQIKKMTDK